MNLVRLEKATRNSIKDFTIPENVEKKLQETYYPYILKLEKQLDTDLSVWYKQW